MPECVYFYFETNFRLEKFVKISFLAFPDAIALAKDHHLPLTAQTEKNSY